MPGSVRPVHDEKDGLLAFLAQQRDALRIAAHGLTDEQASEQPTAGTLSIAGLVKHCAHTERSWIVETMMRRELPEPRPGYEQEFGLAEGETLADALAFYGVVAAETEAIVRDVDLDLPVPVPDAPWFPKDVDAWSARWVLLHVIEETARHAGHADIVRESLDGRTFYALMDEAEGTSYTSATWE